MSALGKIKISEIKRIRVKPVEIFYRVQESHTKKTRNYYQSTTHRQMKIKLWKQQYSLCTSLIVHPFCGFGNGSTVFVPLGSFLLVNT